MELFRYQKVLNEKKQKFFEELNEDIKELTMKIKKIERKIAKNLEKLQKKHKDSRTSIPLLAFVTFEESVGAHRALQLYRISWWTYWFMESSKRFKGCRLKLERSPEPSTIIWENLGYSRWSRLKRRLLTWSFSILLLLFSAVTSFTDRAVQQSAQNHGGNAPCPNAFDSWSRDQQLQYSQANSGTAHCYCSNLSLEQQSHDSYCQDYYRAQATSGALTYFSAFLVVMINGCIDLVLKKFAEFEKHHSIDELELSVFVRMFILKFINSGILNLVTFF